MSDRGLAPRNNGLISGLTLSALVNIITTLASGHATPASAVRFAVCALSCGASLNEKREGSGGMMEWPRDMARLCPCREDPVARITRSQDHDDAVDADMRCTLNRCAPGLTVVVFSRDVTFVQTCTATPSFFASAVSTSAMSLDLSDVGKTLPSGSVLSPTPFAVSLDANHSYVF